MTLTQNEQQKNTLPLETCMFFCPKQSLQMSPTILSILSATASKGAICATKCKITTDSY